MPHTAEPCDSCPFLPRNGLQVAYLGVVDCVFSDLQKNNKYFERTYFELLSRDVDLLSNWAPMFYVNLFIVAIYHSRRKDKRLEKAYRNSIIPKTGKQG